MSVYLTKTTEWTDSDGEHAEYSVTGEMREDILKRALEPPNDLTSVWMIQTKHTDGFDVEIFIHPFGSPRRSVFNQPLKFEDPKDSQRNFFEWMFENVQN